jgi:hypothetical protein
LTPSKAKAWLNLTAVELYLDSGKIAVIHAANEAPLLIPSKFTPSPDGATGTDWISLMEPKAMMDSSVAVGSRGITPSSLGKNNWSRRTHSASSKRIPLQLRGRCLSALRFAI